MLRKVLLIFCFIALISNSGAMAAANKSASGSDKELNISADNPEDSNISSRSFDTMLAAMLMFGFRGQELNPESSFGKLFTEGNPFNVILFDKDVTTSAPRNIQSPKQVTALTEVLEAAAGLPVFISADQEGGQVRRFKPDKGFLDLPSAQSMGQRAVRETLETAEALGKELKDLGVNMDLAPVADVDVNPYNPDIGRLGRAFNTDPTLVAAHALAFGQGLAKNGVIPVLKHFPGLGCSEKNSHLEPANLSQCWNPDVDLLPYAEIFKAGWPGAVLVGHLVIDNLDSALPASLSRNIVTGLLREGLGWQGVVISDDLQMKSVSGKRTLKETIMLAIDAGVDILLFGNNLEWVEDLPEQVWNALHELLKEGRLTEARVRQSWQRIDALKKAYNLQ